MDRASSRSDADGTMQGSRDHAAYWFTDSLLRKTISICCWGKQPHRHLPELIRSDRAGLHQLDVHLLLPGNAGKHDLHAQPGALFLDQMRLAGEDHLLGHSGQPDREGLQAPFVVVIIGTHFECDGAPVEGLDERQHIQWRHLRPEELERRPGMLFLQLLLDGIGIAENLKPLLIRRRELRHRRPGSRRAPDPDQNDQERPRSNRCLHERFTFNRTHPRNGRGHLACVLVHESESNIRRTPQEDRQAFRLDRRATLVSPSGDGHLARHET